MTSNDIVKWFEQHRFVAWVEPDLVVAVKWFSPDNYKHIEDFPGFSGQIFSWNYGEYLNYENGKLVSVYHSMTDEELPYLAS